MKIAILYIGTGRYSIFWDEFYKSCEKYFIKEAEKHYFFFTDITTFKNTENVTIIPIENEGWPLVTCNRYKYINSIKEKFADYDYLFFFNGNYEFIRKINSDEILPTKDEGGIVAALHPLMKHNPSPKDLPLERNPISATCVKENDTDVYYQACIWGGLHDEICEMLDACEKMINHDLEINFIPIYHDESAFNKYLLNKKHKILEKDYYNFSAEGKPFYKLNKNIKIIQRDKCKLKYGGHAYLRGETDKKITVFSYIIDKIKSIFNKK